MSQRSARHLADGVDAVAQQPPERLGSVDAAGKTAADADDGDRLAPGALGRREPALQILDRQEGPLQRRELVGCVGHGSPRSPPASAAASPRPRSSDSSAIASAPSSAGVGAGARCSGGRVLRLFAGDHALQVRGDGDDVRVVEDQRRRKLAVQRQAPSQHVAQLDRHQRVEAEVEQGLVALEPARDRRCAAPWPSPGARSRRAASALVRERLGQRRRELVGRLGSRSTALPASGPAFGSARSRRRRDGRLLARGPGQDHVLAEDRGRLMRVRAGPRPR